MSDQLAKVENKVILSRIVDRVVDMLPSHVTKDHFRKAALVAAAKMPTLYQCTKESVALALSDAAALGLDISGAIGQAYLVPFNGKVKLPNGKDEYRTQCELIIGFQGLAQLARQTGEIKRIEANVVCENDRYLFQEGSDWKLEFERATGERGEELGAYAMVEFKDGGFQADYMSRLEVEKIRSMSKLKNGIPWSQHWGEMAKKTVFRRLAKWLPMSGEKEESRRWSRALEIDNSTFSDDVVEGEIIGSETATELIEQVEKKDA